MKNSVFITATDTDAGKTWVTNQLLKALLARREDAKALKPVACGISQQGCNEDVRLLLATQGLDRPSDINCYSFAKPAAPSIAAQAEGTHIEPEQLIAWCRQQARHTDICLIEGIGGLMVPLTPRYLVSDWLSDMPDMPVVLIVGAKLGCINHALLSLSHLRQLGREPAWVVINHTDRTQSYQEIKAALTPHISEKSNILTCGYQQANDLQPLLDYLQALSRKHAQDCR